MISAWGAEKQEGSCDAGQSGPFFQEEGSVGTRTPNVSDRRVQRTRRLLHEAFISLILERGYDAVTIRDVVRRAGVGRSTFYTHFADLEEVLVGWPAGHSWLREFAAGGRGERRPLGFTRALLEHVDGHRRVWRALVGKRGGIVVKQRFRRDLLEVVRKDVAALAGKQRAEVVDGVVHYVAGAFMELLFWWLDARTALAPADVDEIFHRLTAPALGAIARPTASTSAPR
jgi:AcrR family transcriptional regulator